MSAHYKPLTNDDEQQLPGLRSNTYSDYPPYQNFASSTDTGFDWDDNDASTRKWTPQHEQQVLSNAELARPHDDPEFDELESEALFELPSPSRRPDSLRETMREAPPPPLPRRRPEFEEDDGPTDEDDAEDFAARFRQVHAA